LLLGDNQYAFGGHAQQVAPRSKPRSSGHSRKCSLDASFEKVCKLLQMGVLSWIMNRATGVEGGNLLHIIGNCRDVTGVT
jgi:hypothetical protein